MGTPVALNYLVSINQLSARNAPVTQEEIAVAKQLPFLEIFSPYIIYAPFVLFVILFAGAFMFQMQNRMKNLKNISMAIVIAVFAASIPTMLTMTQTGVHQAAKAGPEEVPREVIVQKIPDGGIIITWNTDAIKFGSVKISKIPAVNTAPFVYVGDNQVPVKNHTVKIPTLTQNQAYEVEILSGNTWYDNAGKPIEFVYRQ